MSSGLLTMKEKLSFKFEDKFTIISPVGEGPPSMILVRKELGLKDWKSFVAYSKANPGKIRYASPGALTGPHFDMVLVADRLKVDWVHLPQKGGGGILKALTNADANIALLNVAVAAPLLKAGEVIPVVTTSKSRIKTYPDVPTLEELGIKDVGNTLWHAIWAPAATPPATMKILFDGHPEGDEGPEDAGPVRKGRDVGARAQVGRGQQGLVRRCDEELHPHRERGRCAGREGREQVVGKSATACDFPLRLARAVVYPIAQRGPVRGERPRRRAASERDEFASPQLLELHPHLTRQDRITGEAHRYPRGLRPHRSGEMEMGTIASPCRHDAAARHALQLVNLRRPAILHYASWAAVFPTSQGRPVTPR